MVLRLLIFLPLLSASGCVSQATEAEESAVTEVAVVDTVEAPPPEPVPGEAAVAAADACELLLKSLEETRPLLTSLDESLLSQGDRMELAIDRLKQPPPPPRSLECPTNRSGPLGSKEVIGAIEWLYMDPPGQHYRARIDSGADTSSLSASDVVELERDGDDWVRFNFQHDSNDEPIEFELPIKRTVLVRQASSDEPERRFVVELDIRLGQQLQATEFTLTDRSRMTYPVLLGRAFLMDLYVVDVSRSYTHDRYDDT
jgi:hypothetical protein